LFFAYRLLCRIDKAVLTWFRQWRAKKIPISCVILQEKAKKFAGIMGIEGFAASNGWLQSFKVRNGISFRQISGIKNRRVLVIVDNCPSHPKDLVEKLKNIDLHFLPPNTTSHLQPMDMGIIRNIKHHYRNKLVHCIMDIIDEQTEQLTILDGMKLLAEAWGEVSKETISNCFRKAGWKHDDYEAEYLDEEFDGFVTFDDELATSEHLDDGMIVELVCNETLPLEESDTQEADDSVQEQQRPITTSKECIKQLENILLHENTSAQTFNLFYQLKCDIEKS
jgi:hypothetical protein